MRPAFLRIFAFMAALLVALPCVASPGVQYVCHMSGRVIESCCCASESADSAPHFAQDEAQIQSNCCERLAPAEHSVSGRTTDALERFPSAHSVALPWNHSLIAVAPAGLVPFSTRSARAPPALGPPLFIVNCALLI